VRNVDRLSGYDGDGQVLLLRENYTFIEDDVGHELPTIAAAKMEASKALTEIARDILPGHNFANLAIEVRDALGPILHATLNFAVHIERDEEQ